MSTVAAAVPVRPGPALDPLARMRALVEALRSPECYPHPVGRVELLETHISFVLLAGDFAYKVKKPVKLHFLDYSSLESRRHYCHEELRLNARTAPGLYLDVVPITGSPARPAMGGEGPALEYAVRMRRFAEEARLDRMAAAWSLTAPQVDALADEIARLHEGARRTAPGLAYGSPDEALGCALDNFRSIAMIANGDPTLAVPRQLHEWTLAQHSALRGAFAERQRAGFVRECHGDLHLANVVLLEGRPVIFDCIEFNTGFRWIDVMSDLAFVVMDLHQHGHSRFAARLLNAYVERTGDYDGLRVLRYYLVYRAMVRAKIACIRAHQPGLAKGEAEACRETFQAYVCLATRLSRAPLPGLVLMHGLSGSGKTTVSAVLLETLGAIRLRSDVVRKATLGLEPLARTHSRLGEGAYAGLATERTYLELATHALQVLRAGFPVIVDATFLERSRRRRFREIALAERVPFAIVDCAAPLEALRTRIAERDACASDASEANAAVLEAQIATRDPLDPSEWEHTFACDTSDADAAGITAVLVARHLTYALGEKPCATSTSSTAMPTASARCAS